MAKGAGREQGVCVCCLFFASCCCLCVFVLYSYSRAADKSAAQEVSVKRAEEQQERLQKFQEKLQQERENKQEARLKLAQQSQSEDAEKKAAIDEQIKRSERRYAYGNTLLDYSIRDDV